MEKSNVVWSHSRLNTILEDPRKYYLQYIVGLSPRTSRSALTIGSAVHWGIEHNTEDLSDYVDEFGSWKDKGQYGKDQLLPEAMIHGYLLRKKDLFNELVADEKGNPLDILQEYHEVELTCEVPSHRYNYNHSFLGIIDLLLVTKKGFILVDYKTSSMEPDYDKYLEQIYRYIMLLNYNYPNVPIYKIGIINIKKSQIRQKQNENNDSFLMRLKQEYDINADNNIKAHIYEPAELDSELLKKYIYNLSDTIDFAQMILDNKAFFINYSNAKTAYGKSDFYDLYYNVPNAYANFKIRDVIYDDYQGIIKTRPARAIDTENLFSENKISNYNKFKEVVIKKEEEGKNKEVINNELKKDYITDDYLLDVYWKTYEIEKNIELYEKRES